MMGKTHLGVGVMSVVVLSQTMPYELTLGALGVSAVSSILPDIDHPKSFINKYLLPFRNNMVRVLLFILIGVLVLAADYFYFNKPYLKVLGTFMILVGISSHRDGSTHSLVGMLVFVGLFNYLAMHYNMKNNMLPFMIGYGSHIICDYFTNKGIPLFYPIKSKSIKAPITLKTGSKLSNAVENIILSAGFIYIIIKLPYFISQLE